MEPLKDGYSMAWRLERLKRLWKRPRKETSGNLYLELCPDNRIKSFMVVRHRPKGTDPFMEFIGHTADKAIREGNGQVPDNLLLALEGVPERMLPTREELREERPGNIWKLISGYGEITGGKPVPLRRAVYLRAHGREIDRTALEEMGLSPGCRNYEAYETAMERASEGKKALFRLTLVKTERGVGVFNDGLQGPERMRGMLQEMADRFYSAAWEGMKTLSIYRIETAPGGCWKCHGRTDGIFPPPGPRWKSLPAISRQHLSTCRPRRRTWSVS